MKDFSVLSYNIHKGFTPRNRDYVLSDIRDAIRSTQANIVGLQEVLGENTKHQKKWHNWHPEAHFEYLADSVWRHYAYGKNAIYQHGHHGNALLSQYPFQSLFNQDISQWWFSQRGLLHGDIKICAGNQKHTLHIACVHLGFIPYEQYQQCKKISRWLESLPTGEATILMGDFNDWHHAIHKHLTSRHGLLEATAYQRGKPQATYPAKQPKMAMDRIYYRNLNLNECQVCRDAPWQSLSDHCPILARFSF